MSVLLSAVREKNRQKVRLRPKSNKKAKSSKGERAAASAPSPTSYMPSANTKVWNTEMNDSQLSIALQKDTMDIWCNDELMEVTNNFSDEGSELDFCIFDHKARIRITSSGNSKEGMTHTLTIDGTVIPEVKMK